MRRAYARRGVVDVVEATEVLVVSSAGVGWENDLCTHVQCRSGLPEFLDVNYWARIADAGILPVAGNAAERRMAGLPGEG